jgi:hypothetical protein
LEISALPEATLVVRTGIREDLPAGKVAGRWSGWGLGMVEERGEWRPRWPHATALHQAVREGWPEVWQQAERRDGLPRRIRKEVEQYLACGDVRRGFALLRCDGCRGTELLAFSCKQRGLCPSCGARRSHQTAAHLGEVLPRVPYRQWTLSIPFALRWALVKRPGLFGAIERRLVRAILRWQRREARSLERICRYGSRSALALERLSRREDGRYEYRTRKGTMLVFTAAELVKRLIALIPPRGSHLTRFHGVFAPNAKLRSKVVCASAGASGGPESSSSSAGVGERKPGPGKRPRLDWASLQRRTFEADVWACPCGGRRKVLAVVTDRGTVEEVLRNLRMLPPRVPLPLAQSPPQLGLAV